MFAFVVPAADAAFGVSPPFLNADHLVPGAVYSQTIYLVQDQPNEDLPMKATLAVPDHILPWISIDKGLNFTIPKGTRQFPITITVTIPKDEPLDKYSGNIQFVSLPSQSGQVTIALGANVAVNLTIGEGVYESYQAYVTLLDIESGWSPRADVKFRNDGNIAESFDAATFELYDQFDTVRLAYIQKNSDFPATPPFTTNEYTVEFPTDFHIGVGEYWGVASFYKEGKLVATQKTVFQVVPPGSLSNSKSQASQMLAVVAQSLRVNWEYYGAGLLVAGGVYLYLNRKKVAAVDAPLPPPSPGEPPVPGQ